MHMNLFTNDTRRRRILPALLLALLIPADFGALPGPAAAQSGAAIAVPIGEDLGDENALRRVRRQISLAAATLCDSGGVSSIHGNAGRSCRRSAIEAAERQLAERIGRATAARAEAQAPAAAPGGSPAR